MCPVSLPHRVLRSGDGLEENLLQPFFMALKLETQETRCLIHLDLKGYGNGMELMPPPPGERRDWTGMVRVSRVGRAKPGEVSVCQMEMC